MSSKKRARKNPPLRTAVVRSSASSGAIESSYVVANHRRSTTTTIQDISDKELLYIFSVLPLVDLMRVEVVCTRWRWIQGLVCRSKRALILYTRAMYWPENQKDISRYLYFSDTRFMTPLRDSSLPMDSVPVISKALVAWFHTKFPAIRALEFYFVELRIGEFELLLKNWKNIEELVLFGSTRLKREFNSDRFWTALKPLKSTLRRLALPFDSTLQSESGAFIPPRLEQLYTKRTLGDNARALFDDAVDGALRAAVANRDNHRVDAGDNSEEEEEANDVEFNIHYTYVMNIVLSEITFTKRFTGNRSNDSNESAPLRAGFYSSHFQDIEGSGLLTRICFRLITSRCVSITHFDLSLCWNLELSAFLPQLAELANLVDLRLAASIYWNDNRNLTYGLTRRNYMDKLTILSRIKSLSLSRFELTTGAVFTYLQYTFPSVTRIHFEGCTLVKNYKWLGESLEHGWNKLDTAWCDNRLVWKVKRGDGGQDYQDSVNKKAALERKLSCVKKLYG